MTYDDYVYRISVAAPQSTFCTLTLPFSIDLPKDLQWTDEPNWGAVEQAVDYSLTGALMIQEGKKQKGRTITLVGADNMAWLTRGEGESLMTLRDIPALVMNLKFVDKNDSNDVLFSKNVMFRHSEGALDLQNIKNFDQYEPDAWYIVKAIRLMETLAYGA